MEKSIRVSNLLREGSFLELNDNAVRWQTSNQKMASDRYKYKYSYGDKLPKGTAKSSNDMREDISDFWTSGTTILIKRLNSYSVDFTMMIKNFDNKIEDCPIITRRMELYHFIKKFGEKIKTIDFKEV